MIKLKIDNKSVEVPEGTSVMEAAKAAGIHIPAMCMDEERTILPPACCAW